MTTIGFDVLSGDIIDIRSIIKRYEELEMTFAEGWELTDAEKDGLTAIAEGDSDQSEDAAELLAIIAALDECRGSGGDEQWRGDWYPVTLIAEDYFETYARELAEETGMINRDASWPNNHIDWEAAANELRQDYTSVEIDGNTYLTR